VTVYELRENPERFCSFVPSDAADKELYRAFDGSKLAVAWREHAIRAADEPDDKALLPDFALLGVVPVFSSAAVDALRDILEANGQLFPVRHSRRRYFAYNVTTVLDALDESRSVVQRFSSGGVMFIDSYAFIAAKLRGSTIFKIPQVRQAHIFVTAPFVERVKRAELLGFVFRPIWSESPTPA
jgi:hypothetical protein